MARPSGLSSQENTKLRKPKTVSVFVKTESRARPVQAPHPTTYQLRPTKTVQRTETMLQNNPHTHTHTLTQQTQKLGTTARRQGQTPAPTHPKTPTRGPKRPKPSYLRIHLKGDPSELLHPAHPTRAPTQTEIKVEDGQAGRYRLISQSGGTDCKSGWTVPTLNHHQSPTGRSPPQLPYPL